MGLSLPFWPQIYRVVDSFNHLQQPRKPIPNIITAITGITDEEVAGQAIDPAAVEAFVSGAALTTRPQRQIRQADVRSGMAVFPQLQLGLLLHANPLERGRP